MAARIKRRTFVAGLGGAVAWPQPNAEPQYVIRSEDDITVEYNAEARKLRRASSLK
jgi:hypothetical protein